MSIKQTSSQEELSDLIAEQVRSSEELYDRTEADLLAKQLRLASKEGNDKTVARLIDAGADVNQSNQNGETPLHLASHNGHVKAVELLIEAGADVNKVNYGLKVTFIKESSSKISDELDNIIMKPDLNRVTVYDNTPLYEACDAAKSNKIVELLLNAGAKIDAESKKCIHDNMPEIYAKLEETGKITDYHDDL